MLLEPFLHVVRQRPAVGVEVHPRQRAQRRSARRPQSSLGAQHVKAGTARAGLRVASARCARAAPRARAAAPSGTSAGSALMTTRSQATPPHAHRRSACASVRSRPRPCATPAETSTIGRSPEMPKRQSSAGRRPRLRVGSSGVGGRGRVRSAPARWSGLDRGEVLGADVQLAQADAGQRGRHQRGALDVAAAAGTCRSRARSVSRVVGGGGAEGQRAPCIAARSQRARAQRAHGSSPVSSVRCRCRRRPPAGSSNAASGWLASRLRPSQRAGRSARRSAARPAASAVGQEVRRVQRPARSAGAACARTAAPVARPATRAHEQVRRTPGALRRRAASASVTSKAEISSSSSVRSPTVAQLDLAELDVVLRADPHRACAPRARASGVEAARGRRGSCCW